MGITTINIAIILTDDEYDRLDQRAGDIGDYSLDLLGNIIGNALCDELGIISKVKITKIE